MGKRKKLFDQFPPVSSQEWMDKILSDLKGADFKKLIWKFQGIDVMPFYREEDLNTLLAGTSMPGEFPFRRGTRTNNNNWLVRQDIEVTGYKEANEKALDILMKGIDSLGFKITDPSSVNQQNFEILLKDIHPEAVELNFFCNGMAKEILQHVTAVCSGNLTSPSNLSGAIEADPLGRLMVNGTLCMPPEKGFDYLAELTRSSIPYKNLRTIHINASSLGNAGADIVQELAYAVSIGSEYMSQLTDRGINSEDAASKIRFSFGTGPDYFPEIAKLRAARILWAIVMRGFCKNSIPEMKIHCTTAGWNKTVYDPYVNMLRTQTEAMAAVLGGTDSLTVGPFDIAYSKPDVFSERIARNQQLILKEEAGFSKVADPAAGSYYIERLTDLLADAAWKLYLRTEEQGGFLSALQKGFIQKDVAESAGRRKKDVASRKTILLGTNQYPNTRERLPEKADHEVINSNQEPAGNDVEPLLPFRAAKEYENIRMKIENLDRKPHVFLLTIGNPVMRKARAQFSSVFFACGGYKVTDNNGFESVEAGVSAALDSNADIVVICSSDDEYALFAPEIYKNLNNSCIVAVAGNPSCSDVLKASGIEHFIHIKSDVPEVLKCFSSKLGINVQ